MARPRLLAVGVAWLLAGCGTTALPVATGLPAATPQAAFVTSSPSGPLSSASVPGTGPRATEPAPSRESRPGEAPFGATERAVVVRVVDGDTIVVDRGNGEEKLRYIGVDTPETVKPNTPVEFMGKEASAANRALVDGREVVLERDLSETDRYGRLLRYVWVEDPSSPSGWLFVNLALVAAGYAQVVTYPPDVRYVDLYLAAQRDARERELGLWSAAGPAEPSRAAPGTGGPCDPAYPGVCIPPSPPDLDCGDIPFRRFEVIPPDPHRFDGNQDGVGCEGG